MYHAILDLKHKDRKHAFRASFMSVFLTNHFLIDGLSQYVHLYTKSTSGNDDNYNSK